VDEESLPTGHDVVDQILREHLVVFALDGAELFVAFRRPDVQVDCSRGKHSQIPIRAIIRKQPKCPCEVARLIRDRPTDPAVGAWPHPGRCDRLVRPCDFCNFSMPVQARVSMVWRLPHRARRSRILHGPRSFFRRPSRLLWRPGPDLSDKRARTSASSPSVISRGISMKTRP
jgi:hypothetical protein